MKRPLLAALAAAAVGLAAPAHADYDAARAQLINSVERELPRYARDVDLSQLSNAKLAEIKAAIHGPGSERQFGRQRGFAHASHRPKISSEKSMLGNTVGLCPQDS